MIDYQDYIDLITDIASGIKQIPIKPYSFLLYGSLSRFEICAGLSDIDLLYVSPSNTVTANEICCIRHFLQTIKNPHNIKIHLRVRGLNDFSQSHTGPFDCGVPSFINKLRDGICLYGHMLDELYFNAIMDTSIDEIKYNLTLRLSKYRYDVRALINSNLNSITPEVNVLRTLISNLAELICYCNGHFFRSKSESLELASHIYDTSIFRINYKKNHEPYDFFISDFIQQADSIAYDCQNNLKIELLSGLKNINILHKGGLNFNSKLYTNNVDHIRTLSNLGIRTFKTSNISENILTINIYDL